VVKIHSVIIFHTVGAKENTYIVRVKKRETMSDTDIIEPKPVSKWKLRVTGALLTGMMLVGYASAAIDFGNITTLLAEVVLIMPGILNLIVGVAPVIICDPYNVSIAGQNCGNHLVYRPVHQ
jgi:hypothetical protein